MWDVGDLGLILKYQSSYAKMMDAVALCTDDPIKLEMTAYNADGFNAVQARIAGVEILVKKGDLKNKKFIIQEMKEVIKCNNEITQKIHTTLEELKG